MITAEERELLHHPHDGYFKAAFSDIPTVSVFLKTHLPAQIASLVDWSTLRKISATHVSDTLEQSQSDLVFTAKTAGYDLIIHFLFEHQTTPQAVMPLRLWLYEAALLSEHYKTHGLPLPVVLTFVLHQGPASWLHSTRLESLFALPPEIERILGAHLPHKEHCLLDLSRYDPATQECDPALRMILQLMKCNREKRLEEFFDWLAAEPETPLPPGLLRTSLLYALGSDANLDFKRIAHKLDNRKPLQEQTMSIAQQLIQQGHEQGREEGREEGICLGILNICLRQARKKFGPLSKVLEARIGDLPYTRLEQLGEGLLDFQTVTDLEAWLDKLD